MLGLQILSGLGSTIEQGEVAPSVNFKAFGVNINLLFNVKCVEVNLHIKMLCKFTCDPFRIYVQ